MRLANDIFGWEIDFALDIQPGDRFNLVYEQKFRDGEYIGDGRILAADFINDGTLHRAVYFESADGKIADYFAPDGRSMRRQFLRAPLDFTRISSNFNPRAAPSDPEHDPRAQGRRLRSPDRHDHQGGGRRPCQLRRHQGRLWARRDPRARRRHLDAVRPHVALRERAARRQPREAGR